jgi:ribosomal protein S8E
MSFRKNLGKKQVSKKNYLFDLQTLSTIKKIEPETVLTRETSVSNDTIIKIVDTSEFNVSNEDLLLVKTNESVTIFLYENSNNFVTIKSLTNTTIKPINSKIDEEYDELTIGKGACVELHKIEGYWYIISSDGIKMD